MKLETERLLLRAKDHRDRPLFRFFAEDMRLPLLTPEPQKYRVCQAP